LKAISNKIVVELFVTMPALAMTLIYTAAKSILMVFALVAEKINDLHCTTD
jgi:hypothetical protein